MRQLLIYTLVIASALLGGCDSGIFSVYRLDIQQGNALDMERVNQLEIGMDERQVRFLMGTPLLTDTFHDNRWDYLYWFKPGRGDLVRYRVTVFFDAGKVIRIDKEGLEDVKPEEVQTPGEEPDRLDTNREDTKPEAAQTSVIEED